MIDSKCKKTQREANKYDEGSVFNGELHPCIHSGSIKTEGVGMEGN